VETVIGSAVQWLFATQNAAFGASFTWLGGWKIWFSTSCCFTHGSSNVPLLFVI